MSIDNTACAPECGLVCLQGRGFNPQMFDHCHQIGCLTAECDTQALWCLVVHDRRTLSVRHTSRASCMLMGLAAAKSTCVATHRIMGLVTTHT